MKNFWKKFLCAFILIFCFSTLVACEKKPENPTPSTQQGSGGTGNGGGTGTGNSGGNQTTVVTDDELYTKLRTHTTSLTNEQTGKYEIEATSSESMGMTIDDDAFLAKNTHLPDPEGTLEMYKPFLNMDLNSKAKTFYGYDGATKEGYNINYYYNDDQEKYVLADEYYTIKDGTNILNYDVKNEHVEYVGEDYAHYAYNMGDEQFRIIMENAGLTNIANNESYADYKNVVYSIVEQPIDLMDFAVDGDIKDYITVISDIVEESGKYILKNDLVMTDMKGTTEEGIETEFDGTAKIYVYFTNDGIEKIEIELTASSYTEVEEEGLVVPFTIEFDQSAELTFNNFNTSNNAIKETDYLTDCIGSGVDGAIEKAIGGYSYSIPGMIGEAEFAPFGESITPLSANDFVTNAFANSLSDEAQYYEYDDLKWYTDYLCTELADESLTAMTVAPSYTIELYTKPTLKSEYVKINLKLMSIESYFPEYIQNIYLTVSEGNSINLSINEIMNNYVYAEDGANFASDSLPNRTQITQNGIEVDAERVSDDVIFEAVGGGEYNIEIIFNEISYVEDNEISYTVMKMTEEQYQIYQEYGYYDGEKSTLTETIAEYDPSDESTHSVETSLSDILTNVGVEVEVGSYLSIYINKESHTGELEDTITVTCGTEYEIIFIIEE